LSDAELRAGRPEQQLIRSFAALLLADITYLAVQYTLIYRRSEVINNTIQNSDDSLACSMRQEVVGR
jgi:hypothetical protein